MADEDTDLPIGGRRVRADAQRNLQSLLLAAKAVFAESGTEAPVREIADRAGVGVGTLYRHYPRRADLIAAVFARELDASADEADRLFAQHPPFDALAIWMQRFVELTATKSGLSQTLHSGDPAFDALPARRDGRLRPAFRRLFDAAVAAGEIGRDIDADEFLDGAARLCSSTGRSPPRHAAQLVGMLVEGLRLTPKGGAT